MDSATHWYQDLDFFDDEDTRTRWDANSRQVSEGRSQSVGCLFEGSGKSSGLCQRSLQIASFDGCSRSCCAAGVLSVSRPVHMTANSIDLHSVLSIQPPGMVHTVYTVERAIALGGHFFMDDAMHLSYWARVALQQADGQGTNAYNEFVVRSFSRMIIAMAKRSTPGESELYHRFPARNVT